MTVFVHRPEHDRWCDLFAAHPGGRIITLCRDAIAYARVLVATTIGREHQCPACRGERRRIERAVELSFADLGGEAGGA